MSAPVHKEEIVFDEKSQILEYCGYKIPTHVLDNVTGRNYGPPPSFGFKTMHTRTTDRGGYIVLDN